MQAMPCEAVKRNDPGCCDCVVERTTGPFRFRLNAGGTPNTKTAAPERELFCFEWPLCPLVQLDGSFANDFKGLGFCGDVSIWRKEVMCQPRWFQPLYQGLSMTWTITSSTCEAF